MTTDKKLKAMLLIGVLSLIAGVINHIGVIPSAPVVVQNIDDTKPEQLAPPQPQQAIPPQSRKISPGTVPLTLDWTGGETPHGYTLLWTLLEPDLAYETRVNRDDNRVLVHEPRSSHHLGDGIHYLEWRLAKGQRTDQTTMEIKFRPRDSNAQSPSLETHEPLKPRATIPAQECDNLTVHFRNLQGHENDDRMVIELDLENTDGRKNLAVAMPTVFTNDRRGGQVINSSLESFGITYHCVSSDIAVMGGPAPAPPRPTVIGPGETKRVSLEYRIDIGPLGRVPSIKIDMQLLVNSDLRGDPSSFPPPPPQNGVPPGFKTCSVKFNVPLKRSQD